MLKLFELSVELKFKVEQLEHREKTISTDQSRFQEELGVLTEKYRALTKQTEIPHAKTTAAMNLQITLENSKTLHAEISELIDKCQRASADLPRYLQNTNTNYPNIYSNNQNQTKLAVYKPQIIPRQYNELDHNDCDALELVQKCHFRFTTIKRGLEKLETVHLAKMFQKQQDMALELSEKESKLDYMERKLRIYQDFNEKLKEKYKEMGRDISDNLNRLHQNSSDSEVGKVILAVLAKTENYFEKIQTYSETLIEPVVNSFQQIFCLYLNARRWLKEFDPDRLDFLAPDVASLNITSDSVKSELFLECCKLRDELTGIKMALGDKGDGNINLQSVGATRKCSEGFGSESSEDEWNWSRNKFGSGKLTGNKFKGEFSGGKFSGDKFRSGGDKSNDGHLRKVVNEKIGENADSLS